MSDSRHRGGEVCVCVCVFGDMLIRDSVVESVGLSEKGRDGNGMC